MRKREIWEGEIQKKYFLFFYYFREKGGGNEDGQGFRFILFKYVLLKTLEYFFLGLLSSSLLIIFLMSWLRWWNKCPISIHLINIKLTVTNNQAQCLRMTSKMVKSAWASMEHFLQHFNPDIRKIIIRLEGLHLKILKRKYSKAFNRTCSNIYVQARKCSWNKEQNTVDITKSVLSVRFIQPSTYFYHTLRFTTIYHFNIYIYIYICTHIHTFIFRVVYWTLAWSTSWYKYPENFRFFWFKKKTKKKKYPPKNSQKTRKNFFVDFLSTNQN